MSPSKTYWLTFLISYCDSTETLAERQQKLAHHGFRCSCRLCEEDDLLDHAALANANIRLKQLASGNPSENDIRKLIEDFTSIFGPRRTMPTYPLCHCYRLLSDILAGANAPLKEIEAAEIAALEALGAKIRDMGSIETESTACNPLILQDPQIAMQEAIVGCLKLVALHRQVGNTDLAR